MTYIILKNCDLKSSIPSIALATALNEKHIKAAPKFNATRLSTSFNCSIQNKPEGTIWHYLKHIAGLSFADVIEVSEQIKTDKYLISTFGKKYCGVVDASNYRSIEKFCRYKVCFNALNTAERVINTRLSHIEYDESSSLILHVQHRRKRVEEELSTYPENMLRRIF